MSNNVQRLSVKPSVSELISSSDDSDDTYAGGYSTRGSTSQDASKRTSLKIPGGAPSIQPDADDDIDLTQNKLVVPGSYASIPKNSKIIYIKTSGKKIQQKFFKSYDNISDCILVGFYVHDRRNYSEKISNIKQLFISNKTSIDGGAKDDPLKGTLELDQTQWKALNRDTIISYQKKDGEWVYKAKFNAFVKSRKDDSTRISMTSEKGYSFVVNPNNVSKIYRHISSNDKTLTFILQNLKQLEQRFIGLDKNLKHLNSRLDSIEKRFKR
jgi:hypothetical protein